jgi:thiosulfate/3-mercaptopyruvate sulfurtransferase
MKNRNRILAAAFILLAVMILPAAAANAEQSYPNADLLASPHWLKQHLEDENLVIVDVRDGEKIESGYVGGAVHLPWKSFRTINRLQDVPGVFNGVPAAEKALGRAGIEPDDTIVLYASTAKNGGIFAAWVFWVLELLGHEEPVMILDGGIEGWKAAGGWVKAEPASPEPVEYVSFAPRPDLLMDAHEVYSRLDDRYYQLLDVRSPEEYRGELTKPEGLDLGHIPGAVHVHYMDNLTGEEVKRVKPCGELREMYAGLHPDRAVVPYCSSAARGAYGYFIMRLMGFEDVRLYDGSWLEWGSPKLHYPVELKMRELSGEDTVPACR